MAAVSQVGSTASGQPISQYTLSHGSNLTVRIMDFGATILSVHVPDAKGAMGEVTLGYDDAAEYVAGRTPYFGTVAGRVANRISKGSFSVDGKSYAVAVNNGPNSLHGGLVGFDKCLWTCEAHSATSLTLLLHSADGDEGYPGNLDVKVTYSLPTPTELRIEYSATTDAPTPINLTNHSYWNLRDGGETDVLDHEIELAADFYVPVDETSIPTGEIRAVSGAMDLRTRGRIGRAITEADNGMGYDHTWVMRGGLSSQDGLRAVSRVYDPVSGRWMVVRSDQPGVQFYTGNYLTGASGRTGGKYSRNHGFCLETQKFPDAINVAHFQDIVLRPGQSYRHVTVHEFGAAAAAPEAAESEESGAGGRSCGPFSSCFNV
ncbi:unnamed protein product [Polarella glacialis]|uniref:Aldose 1-epimerase n=1 Tax=Polarella glacialis TaxID=89957 RepID=A0A813E4F1_POLGL|nr:unnamed protein product [Polarella glacialis]